ncbi:MAG: diacylglycerol kinase family protein [Flavobacteriales bacterium]|nr:diacylglycerol kinase family protein [Flavobacteriales bacterium]
MKRLIRSFQYAIQGMKYLFSYERNAQVHLFFAILSIGMAYYFELNSTEWILIIVCISLVLSAEAFNTSIERMCDLVSKERSQQIKIIKDVSAAAVTFLAIASFIIGLILFVPKMLM